MANDPRILDAVAGETQAGERLDVFAAALADLTRSRTGALIRDGHVLIDGLAQNKAGFKLKPGMRVRIEIPQAAPAKVEAEDIELQILYQDDDLAVVFKPSGMVVHPAAGNENGTLVTRRSSISTTFPESAARSGPALCIESTRIPPDFCWWRKMTKVMSRSRHRSRPIPCSGPIGQSSSEILNSQRGPVEAPIGRHPTEPKEDGIGAGRQDGLHPLDSVGTPARRDPD